MVADAILSFVVEWNTNSKNCHVAQTGLLSQIVLLCQHLIRAVQHSFHVVLFIMLYKVVLTFRSVDETLVCDHSNKTY